MKKTLLLFGIGLLLMQSCRSDSAGLQQPDEILTDQFNPEEATGVRHDIMVNILASKFGGYRKGVPNTRAAGAVSLTPYIENGDTLLYIAQYEKGWELYSASTAAPMVIFSSPDGVFDINDPDMPEAMRDLIYSGAKSVAKLKADKVTDVHPSWASIAAISADTPDGKITVKTAKGVQKVIVPSDLPPGHWVHIESEIIEEKEVISEKLIKTKWYQSYPWNQYAKTVKAANGNYYTAVAGCSPVALSQYMYFTHYKDGIPSETVYRATPTSDGLDFIFSGSSSTIWDNMALTFPSYLDRMEDSAILIGYVGRQLNSDYGITATSTKSSAEIVYLSKIYGESPERVSFDTDYIKRSIAKGYPVIANAYSNKLTDGTNLDEDHGHTFIIDQHKWTEITSIDKYGYIADEWNPEDGDTDPWEDNDTDEEGNIIGYIYTREETSTVSSDGFTMNWGDNKDYDNVVIYSSKGWKIGNYVFNLGSYILVFPSLK